MTFPRLAEMLPTVSCLIVESVKPWFLYLLECADGSIYTGITTDVEARFLAHQTGKGARYTRTHPPVKILGSFSYPDRSSASKAEYRVKQLSASQKRALCSTANQA
jgi:putative endonuclease